MELHWNAIIEGITAGVVASLLLGSLALLRSRTRNLLLRWKIHRDLKNFGVGGGIQGVHVLIRNRAGRVITVRRVAIATDSLDYVLNPTGEVRSSFKGQNPKLTRALKKRLKKGEMIQMGGEIQFGSWRSPAEASGFTKVSPFTEQTFELPARALAGFEDRPTALKIVLEYEAWTGDVRISQYRVRGKVVDSLRREIDKLRSELQSGNFNKARRMFNLPEVEVPKQKAVDPAVTKLPEQRK